MFLLERLIAFAAGLAARLRGDDEVDAILRHLPLGDWSSAPNPTDTVLAEAGRRCLQLMAKGAIGPIDYSVLEVQLTELSHVQAGCERIKNTPLPYSYSLLLLRTAYAFCVLLPFALAASLLWWTPLLTFIVSYAFFGLDALGDELGNPFGTDQNDLALNSMVRTIERDLLHAAGRMDLPPMLEPDNFVLM